MKKKLKEITALAIADTHTGHVTGLTPPQYDPQPLNPADHMLWSFRRSLWDWFAITVNNLKPIDVLMGLGDIVDGPDRGARDYPNQTLIHDRGRQAEAAAWILNWIGANRVVAVAGTPRHTGKEESWEEQAYRMVKSVAHIGVREVWDIGGLRINAKHNLSRSGTPYGQPNLLTKSAVMQEILAAREREVKAPLILRAHVHMLVGVVSANWEAWTVPSLQGASRYADGNGDGPPADMGLFWVKIRSADDWEVKWELFTPYDAEAAVIVV